MSVVKPKMKYMNRKDTTYTLFWNICLFVGLEVHQFLRLFVPVYYLS
jgi:hypothetical protein